MSTAISLFLFVALTMAVLTLASLAKAILFSPSIVGDEWLQPDELCRGFVAIRDEWKQQLEQQPHTDYVRWTDAEPVVLREEECLFLFKELKLKTQPVELDILEETTTVLFEVSTYAVAIPDGNGGWRPTEICIFEKDSAEAALAEMKVVRNNQLKSDDQKI